ncbi:MAG TPA: hypothetical protein VFM48_13345, partial [Aquabacterium sp.]|nr:hypothetical protein [Aquabacterium sp.]
MAIWVLSGCAIIFMTANWMIGQPELPVTLRATADGLVRIQAVDYSSLQKLEGRVLTGIEWQSPDASPGHTKNKALAIDLLMLQRSARWIADASQRRQFFEDHRALEQLLQDWQVKQGLKVTLLFQSSPSEAVWVGTRGWTGLSPLFWILSLLAVMVYAVGAVVVLAAPQWRNFAFMLMAVCHGVELELIAVTSNLDLFVPTTLLVWDSQVRAIADMMIAATVVVVAALHPRRLPGWQHYIALTSLSVMALMLSWTE